MNNEQALHENPYAAPQAELRPMASSAPLASTSLIKYLSQGVVAGMQMGGFGALITLVIYASTWTADSSVPTLILAPVVIFFFCTSVGFLVGLTVQLFALLFGIAPRGSMMPSLPDPSLEPPENTASQEWNKTSYLPPPTN
jgi:hypothetical protein